MTPEIAFVAAVTLAAVVVFVKGWFAPDGVAAAIVVVLVAGGAIEPREAFECFGNEALVTVAAMFALSAGLVRTGAVAFLGRRIAALGGRSEARLVVALMAAAALCSAFVNNTPVAVIFLPLVLGIAEDADVSGSKLLLPMSYATIVGGMCTVIGTSTNVLVSSVLPNLGLAPLSLFEPLPLALAGIVLTIAYMAAVGRRLLPARTTVSSTVRSGKIRDYLSEIHLPAGSPLSGATIQEGVLARAPGLRVLQLIRDESIVPSPPPSTRLREGDVLLVKGEVNAMLAVQRADGIALVPELAASDLQIRRKDTTLAELLVRPASAALGERVRDLQLHARYGVVVLAVQRHGTHIRQKVADLRLRFGDVLLVQAGAKDLERLRESPEFVVLEGVQQRVVLSHKAWIALTVVGGAVALAAAEVQPISILAFAGALAMVVSGCLTVREVYRAIDLPVLVLLGGTIALGRALDASGAAALVARGLVDALAPIGDRAVLAAVYLACNVLTALVSNAGAALVTLPIAIETARGAGLSTEPFVLATMFAASIDFSTPIGYQTNTFVYGPGGYRFSDYVRVGLPLNLLWWGLATLLIPVFWPFR
jgi:di/tricarboxylate transporter